MPSQPDCYNTNNQQKSLYKPPHFTDSTRFLSDFKKKLPLKKILDSLKDDGTLGLYDYIFKINEKGKIIPIREEFAKDRGSINLHNYIYSVFNSYKWRPGNKKNCYECKIASTMQMLISFNIQSGIIDLEIKQLDVWKSRVIMVYKAKLSAKEI